MEVPGRTQDDSTKDNTGTSSDEDGKIFCQPCSSDGDMAVAIGYCLNCNEYMCSVCLKVHRKQALSRNHNILDGDNLPKVALQNVSQHACTDICPKHSNEITKYYCPTHDVVGCGDCMVIDHKSCKVDRIQDISTEYFNGTEHQDILKKVEQFVKVMDKMKKDLQASEKNMKQAFEKAVKDVRTFKEEIIDYLDKAEGEIIEMLAKREQRDKSLILKLKQDEKRLDDDIQEIKTKLQLQQNQANKLFVEAKNVKAKLCSFDENLEQLKKDANTDYYEFRRSSRLSQIIDSGLKLGELSSILSDTGKLVGHRAPSKECITSVADLTIIEKKNISEMEAYFDCEIDTTFQDDDSDCYINECVLLSQNQLIVANNCKPYIKIVDVKNKVVSKYKLKSWFSGVTVVNSNLIAITFKVEKKIQFLAITTDNKITERNMMKVDECCHKIVIHEDKIIGIEGSGKSVMIMSMSGQKIKSISHPKLTCLMDIVVVPNSEMFYVSNNSSNTGVYKLDFEGNLIATYEDKDLLDVRGLEVTRDGTMLVCNWAKDGSIHMITPDCKKIKELLKKNEHINFPWCVAFCNETNTLYVVNNMNTLDRELKNVLKVFQLK